MTTHDIKVCLIGKISVGKTSITNRFLKGTFEEEYRSTVGSAFSSKFLYIRDVNYRCALWDTSGQERFRSLAPLTYRGASAAIIVYDITDKESFEAVDFWMSDVRQKGPDGILIYIVGNKLDLESFRVVDQKAAVEYADTHGAFHFQSSAKTGHGVEDIFINICELIRSMSHDIRRQSTIRIESMVNEKDDNGKGHGHGCKCRHS